MSLIDTYRTRAWRVAGVCMAGGTDLPPFEQVPDSELDVCASDSEYAQRIGESRQRFYFDLEAVAAGFSPRSGGQLGRLAASWRGLPAGTLLLMLYTDVMGVLNATYLAEVKVDFCDVCLARATPRQAEDFILATRSGMKSERLSFNGHDDTGDDSGLSALARHQRRIDMSALAPWFRHEVWSSDRRISATYRLHPGKILDDGFAAIVPCRTRPDADGVTVNLTFERPSGMGSWKLTGFDFEKLVPLAM